MEKVLGFTLQAAAACLFFTAGAAAQFTDGASLLLALPGSVTGFAGMVLWARTAAKAAVEPPPPPALVRAPQLPDAQIVRLQEALVALQEDVSRLREDRDFFQKLYAGERTRTSIAAAAKTEGDYVPRG